MPKQIHSHERPKPFPAYTSYSVQNTEITRFIYVYLIYSSSNTNIHQQRHQPSQCTKRPTLNCWNSHPDITKHQFITQAPTAPPLPVHVLYLYSDTHTHTHTHGHQHYNKLPIYQRTALPSAPQKVYGNNTTLAFPGYIVLCFPPASVYRGYKHTIM